VVVGEAEEVELTIGHHAHQELPTISMVLLLEITPLWQLD